MVGSIQNQDAEPAAIVDLAGSAGQTYPSATGHRPSNNWNETPGRRYSAGAWSDTNDMLAEDSDWNELVLSSTTLHSSGREGAETSRIVAE